LDQPFTTAKRVDHLGNTLRKKLVEEESIESPPKNSTTKVTAALEASNSKANPSNAASQPFKLVPVPKVIRITSGGGMKRILPSPAGKPAKVQKVLVESEKFVRVVVKDEPEEAADEEKQEQEKPPEESPAYVIVKEEPEEETAAVDVSIVKQEPLDDFEIPQFPLTNVEALEMSQNVVVKEEYELGEEAVVVGFQGEQFEIDHSSIPLADPDEEGVRQAIIDAFNSTNELVIRENVKAKIERKKQHEMRRKTLALSIPQDVNVVENVVTKEQPNEQPEIKLKKIIANRVKRRTKPVDNSRFTKFRCEHCTVVSRSRALVVKHIKEMHAFPCNVCLQIFPTSQKLALHKETMHNIQKSEDGGRRKQKLQAITEDKPAAFRLHTKNIDNKKL
jgi:hypothetical protein